MESRILLVEDNEINQKVALGMLERLGFTADLAENGYEAIDAFKRRNYSIILMDIQMPGMNGIDAASKIRELKDGDKVNIIAMTAYVTEYDKKRCVAAGMDGFIAKPFRMNDLRSVIGAPNAEQVDGKKDIDIFDEQKLLQRLEGDVEFMQELIEIFIHNAPQKISEIESALGSGDMHALAMEGHSLKGAAASVEAVEIVALAAQLQNEGERMDISTAATIVKGIGKAFENYKSLF